MRNYRHEYIVAPAQPVAAGSITTALQRQTWTRLRGVYFQGTNGGAAAGQLDLLVVATDPATPTMLRIPLGRIPAAWDFDMAATIGGEYAAGPVTATTWAAPLPEVWLPPYSTFTIQDVEGVGITTNNVRWFLETADQ